MLRGDPEPGPVVLGLNRGRSEDGPLFVKVAHDSVGDLGDLFPAEHADDLINLRDLLQEHLALAFGQATRDDHPFEPTLSLAVEHLADHAERLLAGRVDETAGVDDHQVGRVRVGNQSISVLGQQAEHPLGVDQVLGTTQADERVRAFEVGSCV